MGIESRSGLSGRRSVFLSVQSSSLAEARQLKIELEEAGVDVWLFDGLMQEGDSIPEEIEIAIERSNAFIAWYDEAYDLSKWCQEEISIAYSLPGSSRKHAVQIFNPQKSANHITNDQARTVVAYQAPRSVDGEVDFRKIARDVGSRVAFVDLPLASHGLRYRFGRPQRYYELREELAVLGRQVGDSRLMGG